MTVTVDSQSLAIDELGLETLGDVLTHIQAQNRLVTHVLIDGQAPDLDHVPQLRRRSLQGHTVFIETTLPNQIAVEVLNEIEKQMDLSETARLAAIDHLSVGEPNKALQKLSGCFTIWQSAQEAIKKIAVLLRVDLDIVRVEDISLAEALHEFAEQLKTIKSSIESRDFVVLADTLQYEVSHTVRQWRDALTQLRQIVS